MRHRKDTFKLGRDTAHRRCLIANMLKALVTQGSIKTTVAKAKELRRHADRLVTIAKKGTLAARRHASAKMMVRHNALTSKEARRAKEGDTRAYNADRTVLNTLFDEIAPRFEKRQGGYTRMARIGRRSGDNAELCVIEFLPE